MVSYTTPEYVSMDQPRSVTLFYSSALASPRNFVQVDATDRSTEPPVKMSVRVRDEFGSWMTFTNGTQELFYAAGAGTTRLAAQFTEGRGLPLGYGYTVVVRSWWADGTSAESTATVRAPLVDANGSFGAGWEMAGLQRLYNQGGGVHIVEDGTGTMFLKECGASGCAYVSPDGDFSTVQWEAEGWTRRYPDGTVVRFDALAGYERGRMSYVEDRFGNRTTYTYRADGRLEAVTDPVGLATTFGYNPSGTLAWVQDPGGRKVTTTTSGGWLFQFRDPDGVLALDLGFEAAPDGQPRLRNAWYRGQDRNVAGSGWAYGYDAYGQLATVSTPLVRADSVVAPLVTTLVSLEAAVLPAPGTGSAATPAARVLPDSVRIRATDPRGNTTRVAVDRFGAPVRVEAPLGRVSVIERNARSQVTREVAPSGRTVAYTWVGSELRQVHDQTTGAAVSYEYGPFGLVTRQYGSVPEVRSFYGGRGELDSTLVVGTGQKTRYFHNQRGQPDSVADLRGHATVYQYDYGAASRGNLISVGAGTVSPRSTLYRHDAFGRVRAVVDAAGRRDSLRYDTLNRTVRTWNAAGDSTSYTYSATGLWKVTDPIGQVYRYERNALGWVEQEVDPRGQALTYTYDRNGNPSGTTNRRGQTVRTTYDALDRPLVVADLSTGAATTHAYDAAERWIAVSNAESTDTLRLDVAGRPEAQVALRAGTRYALSSTHDARGLRTGVQMTAPWSRGIGLRYNARMQLDTLVDPGGGRTAMTYDDDGMLYATALPASTGIVVREGVPSTHVSARTQYEKYGTTAIDDAFGVGHTQDKLGRVETRWNNTVLRGRAFDYDLAGRLRSYEDQEAVPSVGCSYVPLWNPDTGVKPSVQGSQCDDGGYIPGMAEYFTYDRAGNRTDQGAVVQPGNRLATFGPYTLRYDSDGNLTSRIGNGLTLSLTWNALGQLTSVTRNGVSAFYGYDGFGRRVRKSTPSRTLRYLYDGGNLFMEVDASTGQPVREYTYYPGVDEPHSVRSGGQTYYYVTERPGHVTGLVNAQGQVANRYAYSPWGKAEVVQETVENPLRYTAREYDAESGLYFLRARYYDPELGRFVSEDPIRLEGGINPYAYVENDPVNFVDPMGLCREFGSGGTKAEAAQTTANDGWCPIRLRVPIFGDQGWSSNFGRRGMGGRASGVGEVLFGLRVGGAGGGDRAALLLGTMMAAAIERTVKCGAETIGADDLIDVGLIAAGLPIPNSKRVVLPGTVPGTSLAGMAANRVFGSWKLPFRVPTLTGGLGSGRRLMVTSTRSVARAAGRAVPVVGWGMLALDAMQFGACVTR